MTSDKVKRRFRSVAPKSRARDDQSTDSMRGGDLPCPTACARSLVVGRFMKVAANARPVGRGRRRLAAVAAIPTLREVTTRSARRSSLLIRSVSSACVPARPSLTIIPSTVTSSSRAGLTRMIPGVGAGYASGATTRRRLASMVSALPSRGCDLRCWRRQTRGVTPITP